MSEQTTEQTTDAPQEPQGAAEAPPVSPEGQGGTEYSQGPQEDAEGAKGNREAAKYRTRLRAAEAERDTAREQVAALQAAAVARELGALEVPAEVFGLAHPDPGAFLAEDGTVNRDALIEAAGAVRERYNLRTLLIAPSAPRLAPGGERPAASSSWSDKLRT